MSDGSGLPPVMYVAGHSHGPDHLARMSAIAARSMVDVSPFVISTADAVHAPHAGGVPMEYFPRAHWLGMSDKEWDDLTARHIAKLVGRIEPVVVAADDDRLARIVGRMVDNRVTTVRIATGSCDSDGVPVFDHVIESADLVSMPGPVGGGVGRHHVVRPIMSVDTADMMSRGSARYALGLPLEPPAVLVDVGSEPDPRVLLRARDVIRERNPGAVLFVPTGITGMSGIVNRPVHSIERYLHGFDAVVTVASHLQFHMVVASGTPAVFVPDVSYGDNGQAMRGKLAASHDVGLYVDDIWSPEFESAVHDVLDPAVARRVRTASMRVHPGSGTTDAARIIAAIALGISPD